MKFPILLLGAVASGVLAVPTPNAYTLHERRDHLPSEFSEGKRLAGHTSLPVRIGLTQNNLDHGHDLLTEV